MDDYYSYDESAQFERYWNGAYVEIEEVCPCCGAVWGMDGLDRERCAFCGWPQDECEDDESETTP